MAESCVCYGDDVKDSSNPDKNLYKLIKQQNKNKNIYNIIRLLYVLISYNFKKSIL